MHQFAALDCILNEHFEELKIRAPGPVSNSFPILMSIIAQRCPNLKRLEILFHGDFRKLIDDVYGSDSSATFHQHQNLDCLTHLTLRSCDVDITVAQCDSVVGKSSTILSLIGEFCPALTKLDVSLGFCLKKEHLAGLILQRGRLMSDILFPTTTNDAGRWSRDSVLEGLQVPVEFLNPLCRTLQEFAVHHFGSWSGGYCGDCYPTLSASDYAQQVTVTSCIRGNLNKFVEMPLSFFCPLLHSMDSLRWNH